MWFCFAKCEHYHRKARNVIKEKVRTNLRVTDASECNGGDAWSDQASLVGWSASIFPVHIVIGWDGQNCGLKT